ncbi:MAG: flagellar basal body-associated FliL family protein [Pseudomonadota bacterium]
MVDVTDDMADDDSAPKKGSRKLLLIVLVLSLLLGGGGFFAAFSGLAPKPGFLGGEAGDTAGKTPVAAPVDQGIAFMPLGQIVIPLSPRARAKHLLLEAELEVNKGDLSAVEQMRPRILDMINTYLRAIDESDLDDPSAVIRLRAQLLRRASVVVAPARPRDLLITSFILK